MEIIEKTLKGVFEIKLKPIKDKRGFFMRSFDYKVFKNASLKRDWVQENHSKSLGKGIVRGLHFQFPPFAETKLIRVIRGSVFDVFVDLRKNSSTFGKWDSVMLSEDKFNCVYIPKGFAHGFCTLTDICDVVYKVDNYYSSEHECGLLWNDPDLNINWPVDKPILSEKDTKNVTLREFIEKYKYINK